MKKDEVERLIQRYILARAEKRDPYFDPDELDDLLNALEDSEDYTYYDEILNAGLRMYPGNEILLLRKVEHLLENDSYQLALDILQSIPIAESLETKVMKMECLCGLDRYKEVLRMTDEILHEGVEISDEEYMFQYISSVLFELGMQKETEDYLKRGLKRLPDSLVLKREMCYLLESEFDLVKALELCEELIDKEPYSFDNWFILGHLSAVSLEFEKAIEALDFAITCADEKMPHEVYLLKAYCLFMNENYEKAIEVYVDLKKDDLNKRLLRPMIAECYMKLEKYEEAYQLLKKAIDEGLEFDDYTIYAYYFQCCIETRRTEEMNRVLTMLLEKQPDHIYVLSLMALTCLEKGDEEGAGEIVEKLLNLPDSDRIRNKEDFKDIENWKKALLEDKDIDYSYILSPMYEQYERKLLPMADRIILNKELDEIFRDKTDFFSHFTTKEKEEFMQKLVRNVGNYDLKPMRELMTKYVPIDKLLKDYFKNRQNRN